MRAKNYYDTENPYLERERYLEKERSAESLVQKYAILELCLIVR